MGDPSWEWSLPSGVTVSASVDRAGVESVRVGRRLVSRSPRGGRPDGHSIVLPEPKSAPYRAPAERDLVVRFDQRAETCALWIGAEPIPPTRISTVDPGRGPWGLVAVAAILMLVILAGVGVRVFRSLREAAQAKVAIRESFRSPDGLLVAHYPSVFAASSGADGVTLTRAERDEIVLLMSTAEPVSNDVNELARLVHEGMRDDAFWTDFSRSDRHPGTCLGEPGVIIEGSLRVGLERGTVWSCVFLHEGHGYFFLWAAPSRHASSDAALLQRIVDSTELRAADPSQRVDARRVPDTTPGAAPATHVPMPSWGRPVVAIPQPAVPSAAVTARAAPAPTPRARPAPTYRPGRVDTVVCDANGACQGVGGMARPPSRGSARGR